MNRHRCRKALYCVSLLVFALAVLQAGVVSARIYIDIRSALQKKLVIAIPAFRLEGTGTDQQRLGEELAAGLNEVLTFSGLFRPLDPALFLEEPQQMGLELQEIKFAEWRFLGADLLVRGSCRIKDDRLQLTMRLFGVVQPRLLLKKTYTARATAARELLLGFADEMMRRLTGEPGIFQTKIAFVGDASGYKEIYLADFDGANIRQLTRDRSLDLSPAWSADGETISYVSYRRGNPDLYTIRLMDKAVACISRRPGLNITPAWNPLGDKLAVTLSLGVNPELYLLDSRGRILQQLTRNWSIDVSPAWSPDGRQLAFVSNRVGKPQIYLLDLSSRRSRRLTFAGDYNTSPAWSPRGDRIVYAGFHDGHFDLFLISPDGQHLQQLTEAAGNNESPSWSPDGRLILFQSDRDGSPSLWVMQANGKEQRRLKLGLRGSQTEPAWSPRLTPAIRNSIKKLPLKGSPTAFLPSVGGR